MKKILVGFDGSETAARAADQAAQLARALNAELHVVTVVVERSDNKNPTAGLTDERAQEAAVARAGGIRQQAVDTAKQIEERYPDLDVAIHALKGAPAKLIVETATNLGIDIIVVGNRRVQGIARVLGSVAIDILRDAPCAVHVVKTT